MIQSYTNKLSEIKYVIYLNPQFEEIIVSFRGTVKTQNWGLNILYVKSSIENEIGAGIHLGFKLAYDSVKTQLRIHLSELLETTPLNYTLLFTGHSLGSALATLAALDSVIPFRGLNSLSSLNVTASRISLITFGSPRVGNKAFAKSFNSIPFQRLYRVTNTNDIVPHLPPMNTGYMHVMKEYWMSLDGYLVTCSDSEEEEASDCANVYEGGLKSTAHSLGYLGLIVGPVACDLVSFQGFEK